MKTLIVIFILALCSLVYAIEPASPLLAQMEPQKPIDMSKAQPRVMGLYEQGWEEGVVRGKDNAGKIGWFFAGFGNVPFLWLPWVVEPRRPAKPPIVAEEEFNSGYKMGYRAGWKNTHKTYYIAGTIFSSVAAGAMIIATAD